MKAGTPQAVKREAWTPKQRYRLHEVNLPTGTTKPACAGNQVLDGAALMRDGIQPPCNQEFDSTVIELTRRVGKSEGRRPRECRKNQPVLDGRFKAIYSPMLQFMPMKWQKVCG